MGTEELCIKEEVSFGCGEGVKSLEQARRTPCSIGRGVRGAVQPSAL